MEFSAGKRVLPYFDEPNVAKRTKGPPSPTSINFILNNINDDSSKNSSLNDQPPNSHRSPPPNMIESISSSHHPNTYPSLASPAIAQPQPHYPYLSNSMSHLNAAPHALESPQQYFLSQPFPHHYPPHHPAQHPYITLPSYPQLLSHAPTNQPALRSSPPQLHQPQPTHVSQIQSHVQPPHLQSSPRSGNANHLQMFNHPHHPHGLSPPRPTYQQPPPQPTLQFSPHVMPAKFDPNSSNANSGSPHTSILQHLQPKMFKANRVNTRYITIAEDLLKMRQNDAARRLGIAPSTFSKRWRQTLPERKWPFRQNVKIEKNIKTLQKFESKGHDVSMEMEKLMRQKADNLRDALILIQNDDVSEEYSEGAVEDDQDDKQDEEDE